MESRRLSSGEMSPNGSHLVVVLNVYDFIKHESTGGSVMAFLGFGIHHSGLQIEDTEFTFNNSGIIRMQRLRMPFCRLNESITLGKFWGTNNQLEDILKELEHDFSPGSYNVLNRNCNHFVDSLANRLIGVSIPSWVNRSANVASMMGVTTKNVRKNLSSTNLSGTTLTFSSSVTSASKPKPPPKSASKESLSTRNNTAAPDDISSPDDHILDNETTNDSAVVNF